MSSIYWHDYETFGADPRKDRPSQFAGIRTDWDLNIIEEPFTLYCKPSEDFLPSPDACLITGITPQDASREGVVEAEFARQIHAQFSVPGTCVAGYNNIRFDDEVSRNLFYRNFYDPYEREWKNGNSRWDLIDVVRLTYALRPEGINWPVNDEGTVSFRLEKLTEANGIAHESAHDAMSDVYATIAVAKLIKDAQPRLFEYALKLRDKNFVADMMDTHQHKPVLHVSSRYPASRGCCAMVAPIVAHPKNKNGYVVFDLRQNPAMLAELSVDAIRERLYTASDELPEGAERPALKTIHANKCPMVAPASMLKTMDPERLADWEMDSAAMRRHLDWIRQHPELKEKIAQVFDEPFTSEEKDPDLMIYSGGFFGAADKAEMARIRQASEVELAESEFRFQDARLDEMLFRYKARNFPATLNEEEQEKWARHCAQRLLSEDSAFFNMQSFSQRLVELSESTELKSDQQFILQELQLYAESIIPYF